MKKELKFLRDRIICKCGANVTNNTYKIHLKNVCTLTSGQKEPILFLLEQKTKNHYGWLKKEGLNATRQKDWFLNVLDNKTKFGDWIFKSPRKKSYCTPNSLKRYSIERKGKNNPNVKSKFINYQIGDLEISAKEIFKECLENNIPLKQVHNKLEINFPHYVYCFSGKIYPEENTKRGYNRKNLIICELLNIHIDSFIIMLAKSRGYFISKGQRNSPKFLELASNQGASMISKFRVSNAQMELFSIIKENFDNNAILERQIPVNGITKSYDIYSPKINAMIEMNGRVWHDPVFAREKNKYMHDICASNIKNDVFKKALAIGLGFNYFVFWDNEKENWFNELKGIYENNIKKIFGDNASL